MRSYKVYIDSARWECAPNLVICSRLYQYLTENGHQVVRESETADYIIVNSCGVTEYGRNRTFNVVNKHQTRKNATTIIIVFGCLTDIDRGAIQGKGMLPIGFSDSVRLDEIFATTRCFDDVRPSCSDTLHEELTGGRLSTAVNPSSNPLKITLNDAGPFLLSIPLIVTSRKVKHRFNQLRERSSNNIYVEISRGCTGSCNYCLIKRAKGQLRSRAINDILEDIKRLYDPHKELVLVADDCGCYGADNKSSIIQLLDTINATYPGLPVKLNYIDPRYLLQYSQEFLRLFHHMNIPLIMIPLQSGSQNVLDKMNRHYDINQVLAMVKQIKKTSPSTIINTHYIIGHPGETWKDFLRSLNSARVFDYPAPFKYSDNKGTISSRMKNQTPHFNRSLYFSLTLIYLNLILFFRLAESLRKTADE